MPHTTKNKHSGSEKGKYSANSPSPVPFTPSGALIGAGAQMTRENLEMLRSRNGFSHASQSVKSSASIATYFEDSESFRKAYEKRKWEYEDARKRYIHAEGETQIGKILLLIIKFREEEMRYSGRREQEIKKYNKRK